MSESVELMQVPHARPMPLAPEIPGELSSEVDRLRGLYLGLNFPEFLAFIADEIVKLRRVARAANGGS